MKTPTKFVKPLTEAQRTQLKEIMKSQTPQRKRIRAHAVLLSDRRYSINQIADIYQVERDRVSAWINWWNDFEFAGLDDDERGGRPRILNESEQEQVIAMVKDEPHHLKCAVGRMVEESGKLISCQSLKLLLREAGMRWKRARRSVRCWRNGSGVSGGASRIAGIAPRLRARKE